MKQEKDFVFEICWPLFTFVMGALFLAGMITASFQGYPNTPFKIILGCSVVVLCWGNSVFVLWVAARQKKREAIIQEEDRREQEAWRLSQKQ